MMNFLLDQFLTVTWTRLIIVRSLFDDNLVWFIITRHYVLSLMQIPTELCMKLKWRMRLLGVDNNPFYFEWISRIHFNQTKQLLLSVWSFDDILSSIEFLAADTEFKLKQNSRINLILISSSYWLIKQDHPFWPKFGVDKPWRLNFSNCD